MKDLINRAMRTKLNMPGMFNGKATEYTEYKSRWRTT